MEAKIRRLFDVSRKTISCPVIVSVPPALCTRFLYIFFLSSIQKCRASFTSGLGYIKHFKNIHKNEEIQFPIEDGELIFHLFNT